MIELLTHNNKPIDYKFWLSWQGQLLTVQPEWESEVVRREQSGEKQFVFFQGQTYLYI